MKSVDDFVDELIDIFAQYKDIGTLELKDWMMEEWAFDWLETKLIEEVAKIESEIKVQQMADMMNRRRRNLNGVSSGEDAGD